MGPGEMVCLHLAFFLHVCLFASSFSFDMLYAEYATVKIYGIAISLDTYFVLYWLALAVGF